MAVAAPPLFAFDNSLVRALPGLYEPWQAAQPPAPELLVLNDALAAELGVDAERLRAPEGVGVLSGAVVPPGAEPVAMAYAGHQFGSYSPRLGDGRALLLGEVLDVHGARRDLHLKGSGRTRFARGGDGKAAVGPMLREHLVGEAMHALGIPTTRALAVVATGEAVPRETLLPGAVLTRVAASHLRVGTFEYAIRTGGPDLLRRLADYAIARHHPQAADAEQPYLAFFEAVVEAQSALIARWMLVGFVHGVMNTDNMAISGETIDYGPCAFMDAYDPRTVFSSIDHGGRYAYGNQPRIAGWNLARLGEALLPLIDADQDAAIEQASAVLNTFPDREAGHRLAGIRAKLGLATADPADGELAGELLARMERHGVDMTNGFRALSAQVRGDGKARDEWLEPGAFDGWADGWRARLAAEGRDPVEVADGMDRVNPRYIPRNHVVEDALAHATAGDLGPYRELVEVVTRPFEERPGLAAYTQPAPVGDGPHVTYCGT
jgi:uncharacterized protein YdiU (UPF0061 family)